MQNIQTLFEQQAATALLWRESKADERIARLQRLREALKAHWQEILDASAQDMAKPPAEVEVSEIMATLAEISDAIRHCKRWMAPRAVHSPLPALGLKGWVQSEPRGRCLILAPWNYPFYLTLGPLASCLAAGNTAIVKPSELAPALSALIAKMLRQCFEPHEVAVVEGDAATAETLLKLPFDHIFFTGSPAVGRKVMRAAAEHLTSVTLELGGKSPVIVAADADVPLAAETLLWAKCLNAGQSCIAPDYALVDAAIAERFIAACRERLAAVYGASAAEQRASPHLGRIVNTRHALRLKALIEDARQGGADIAFGGEVDEASRYVAPTLLTSVRPGAAVLQEEIFGPVLPVLTFTRIEEAIAFVNARPKPLALYLWTRDRAIERTVLSRTSAGGSCVNHALVHCTHPGLPFGGVNHSGIGKAHGQEGFRAFSNERAVVRPRWMAERALFPPYTDKLRKQLRFFARWA